MTTKEFKIWLIENGYTVERLAKRVGKSTKTIYQYQANERFPKIFVLALKGLEVSK